MNVLIGIAVLAVNTVCDTRFSEAKVDFRLISGTFLAIIDQKPGKLPTISANFSLPYFSPPRKQGRKPAMHHPYAQLPPHFSPTELVGGRFFSGEAAPTAELTLTSRDTGGKVTAKIQGRRQGSPV